MASTLSGLTAIAGVVAASLYALGAAWQIRGLRRDRALALGRILLVVAPALVLHVTATYLQVHTSEGLYLGFFTAGSLITLLMILFLMLASARLPVQNLLVLALPIGAVALLASLVGETAFEPQSSLSAVLIAHITLSLFAYSILFMAACQSVLLVVQERALRGHADLKALNLLPPLETMETLLFALLWTGIATLTAAIATGFLFLDDMFDQHVVHHTLLAMASWVVYAILLAGRTLFGWRSTTATAWTLAAFLLLVLGYFGTKFVLEIVLGRGYA